MIATIAPPQAYTVPSAAPKVGLAPWQLSRLYERKFLPAPPKVGHNRLIFDTDFPAIIAAAVRAGYLPAEEMAGATN